MSFRMTWCIAYPTLAYFNKLSHINTGRCLLAPDLALAPTI